MSPVECFDYGVLRLLHEFRRSNSYLFGLLRMSNTTSGGTNKKGGGSHPSKVVPRLGTINEPSDSPLVSQPCSRRARINSLSLVETPEASALHCRDMNKDVLAAALRFDEAVPLGRIEPFHRTCRHLKLLR